MANYIEGIHPDTGEVMRVSTNGNFPFKDPETNKFIVDQQGQVVTPGRERERFARLDSSRREVPDPRPMSSAIAFAYDITPEEEVKRLIAQADARVLANYAKAEESGQDFYDDDDFVTADDGGVDNMISPYEFVRDLVAGIDVPRGLKGVLRAPEEPAKTSEVAEPPPPKGKAAKPSKKASKEEPELSFDSEE